MQLAAAAMLLRMGPDTAAAAVQLVDAAGQNAQNLANVAAGIGRNVNISA